MERLPPRRRTTLGLPRMPASVAPRGGDRPLPLRALPASHLMLPVQMQFTCRCNRDSIKSTRRRAGGRDLSRLRRAGHATVAGRCRTVALQTGLPVAGVRLVCYSRSPQVKQSRRATVSRRHFAPLRLAHGDLVSRQRPDGRRRESRQCLGLVCAQVVDEASWEVMYYVQVPVSVSNVGR